MTAAPNTGIAMNPSPITTSRRTLQVLRPSQLSGALAACSMLTLLASQPTLAQTAAAMPALPSGLSVAAGQARISTNGNRMTVVNTPQAILNWNSFSIGANAAVYFQQAGSTSAVLNRVTGNEASAIFGSLGSNGRVWLLNPNGVIFGADARVDVAGLVTSTLRLNDSNWLAGRWHFTAGNPSAEVLNQGELRSSFGGTIALLGDSVRNEGLVQAPGGQIVLAAGSSVELVDTGAANVAVRITAPAGEARNLGTLRAGGGRVDIHAAAVNQQGIVSADGFADGAGGEVWIKASQAVELGAFSRTTADGASGGKVSVESDAARTSLRGSLSAQGASGPGGAVVLLGREVGLFDQASVDVSGALGGGSVVVGGGLRGQDLRYTNAQAVYFGPQARITADATAGGDGGGIVLWSDRATRAFGSLSVRGGPQGGDGGAIETSGGWLDARPTRVDTSAPRGRSGTWLLDPFNILITSNTSDAGIDSTFTAVSGNATIDVRTIVNALDDGTNVTISTGVAGSQSGDITVASASIVASSASPGDLKLIADRNINISSADIGSSNGPMTVTLLAGRSSDGQVHITNSTISTSGTGFGGSGQGPQRVNPGPNGIVGSRDIVIGGYASGTTPTGAAFGNAASSGVFIGQSTLDAGDGNLSVYGARTAGSAAAILATDSFLLGSGVDLKGSGPAGGIRLDGSTEIDATRSASILGRATTGAGVEMAGTAGVWLSSSNGSLLVQGRGGNSPGVDIAQSGPDIAALRVTGGATLTVEGASGTPGSVPGVRMFGSGGGSVPIVDAASGGAVTVRGLDSSAQVSFGFGDIVGSASTNRFGGAAFAITGNATISAAGPIQVAATSVTLGFAPGAPLHSGAAGDAIVVSGPGNTATSAFSNGAGAGALDTPNGRWIIYADSPTSQSWLPGSLPYSYKRYGAGFGAWAGDAGNGFIFSTPQVANFSASIPDKVYDGSVNAPLSNVTVSAALGDQASVAANLTASYTNPNAGTGKLAGFSTNTPFTFQDTSRRPVYGYTLVGTLRGNVTQRPLSGRPDVATRVYDGTTVATVTVDNLSGLVSGETVTVAGFGTFNDKNVGTGKPVQATLTVRDGTGGGLASNYAFNTAAEGLTGTITPLAVTLTGLGADNKIYDGNTAATVHGTPQVAALGGDTVGLSGTVTAAFGDKNVGVAKPVNVGTAGLALVGADAGNYSLVAAQGLTADITPRVIDVSGLRAASKVYDGNAVATLTGLPALNAVVGDQVALGGTVSGAFNDKNVGNAKPVVVSGLVLSGADAANYSLLTPKGLTADITPLGVSVNGLQALDKVYDGSTAASLAGSAAVSALAGDVLSLSGAAQGRFADKNVGSSKPVALSGLTLTGGDAANYMLLAPLGLRASITPLSVSVNGLRAVDKIYDGGTTATLAGTAGVNALAGDAVSLSGTAQGRFADKNVGSNKPVAVSGLALTGGDAANYTLLQPQGLRAGITPLSVSVVGLTAVSKVYDGNAAASVIGSGRVATLAGDAVTLNGTAAATFTDRNVGSAQPVVVTGYGLAGADAANYSLVAPQGLSAGITPATLQYVAATQVRSVGNTMEGLTGTVTGFVGGDTQPSATQGGLRFTTTAGVASPPGDYAVSGTGLSAGNYVFVQAAGNARALSLIDLTPLTAAIVGDLRGDLRRDNGAFSVSAEDEGRDIERGDTGVADLLSEPFFNSQAEPVSDFRAVPLARLSMRQLQDLLSGRRVFMNNLLADAVEQLERNPALADLAECETLEEARLGACRITTKLKSRLPHGTSLSTAALAAPSPATSTSPSMATVAPTVAAAPSAAAPATPPVPPVSPATLAAASSSTPPVVAAVPAGTTVSLELSSNGKRKVRAAALPQIERKIALVVGVDRYADASIPGLNNAVNDARAVARVFEARLGYEAVVVPNATKPALVAALNQLALTLGPRDSVMVYYAGHGELVETTKLGYWLLADAVAKDPTTWLSNTDINRLIGQMGASQVAVVSDSCYSGSLASEERLRAGAGALDPKAVLDRKSVVVMSSGGNEPVFDDGKNGHSPFAWNLMNTLGQVNNWQPGGNVFERVRFAVARTLPQRPQYSASRAAGHQPGGEYLFEQRQLESGQ